MWHKKEDVGFCFIYLFFLSWEKYLGVYMLILPIREGKVAKAIPGTEGRL